MDNYLCPRCGKQAEICITSNFMPVARDLTSERLDLPYFVCVSCSLVGIDWQLIRSRVGALYRQRSNKKQRCFNALYQEIRKSMETIIDQRKNAIGNQEAKFKKIS
jgi:hypothetical protein